MEMCLIRQVRTHPLVRIPKKFKMAATINIESNLITPNSDIRVLSLQIDTKLKWGPYVQKTEEKMIKQSIALTKYLPRPGVLHSQKQGRYTPL